jgi:hypothetical protein
VAKTPVPAAAGPIEVVVADGHQLSLPLSAAQFVDCTMPPRSLPAPFDGLRHFDADG